MSTVRTNDTKDQVNPDLPLQWKIWVNLIFSIISSDSNLMCKIKHAHMHWVTASHGRTNSWVLEATRYTPNPWLTLINAGFLVS